MSVHYLLVEHGEDTDGEFDKLNTYTFEPQEQEVSTESNSAQPLLRSPHSTNEALVSTQTTSSVTNMPGPVGTPSWREYISFDLNSEEDVKNWNLVVDRPHDTKDLRWADSLKLFTHPFTVTPTSLPPASTHLSDHIVGQLIDMCKSGHIELGVLGQRWPSTFNKTGQLLKTRRPLGEPYIIQGKIAAANDGAQLLCGADFDKLPKANSTPKDWFWLRGEGSKGRLRASSVDSKQPDPRISQRFHFKALNAAQSSQNAQPNGQIFDNDSGKPNPALKVEYQDQSRRPKKLKPVQVKAVWRKPDPSEKKDDLKGIWSDREGGEEVQDKLGLIAFALETPDTTKRSKLKKLTGDDLQTYRDLIDKAENVEKAKDDKTSEVNKGKMSQKPKSGSAKASLQSSRGLRVVNISSDEMGSILSRSPELGPERTATGVSANLLIKHLHLYEDRLAKSTTLMTTFLNGNRDMLFQALDVIEHHVNSIGNNAGKDRNRKDDLHDFMKMLKRAAQRYSNETMVLIEGLVDVLAKSAYDIEATFRRDTAAEPHNWFPSLTVRDKLPKTMPRLSELAPVWSSEAAEYPVESEYRRTAQYKELARGHLRRYKGKKFYRRRAKHTITRYLTDEDSSGDSSNDADDEDDDSGTPKSTTPSRNAAKKIKAKKAESDDQSSEASSDASHKSSKIGKTKKSKKSKKKKRSGQNEESEEDEHHGVSSKAGSRSRNDLKSGDDKKSEDSLVEEKHKGKGSRLAKRKVVSDSSKSEGEESLGRGKRHKKATSKAKAAAQAAQGKHNQKKRSRSRRT